MNLITVSIASYNNAKYIERCVDSVINQTYSNLEILIVDDGSKDNTLSLIEKYKEDLRVRVIAKENGGLASVRQRALDEAKGVFICFIDADDYLERCYVEKLIDGINKANSDICVCSTKFVDENDNFLESDSKSYSCIDSVENFKTSPEKFDVKDRAQLNNLHLGDSWNKIYRTDFIKKSGVRFDMPKGLNGTDTLFNRLLSLHAPLYSTISDSLYIHVMYNSSAVHRKKKDLMRTYTIIAERSMYEAEKLSQSSLMSDYIIRKYITSLYFVYVDVAGESATIKDCRKSFNELYKQYKEFRNTYHIRFSTIVVEQVPSVRFFIVSFFLCRKLLPYQLMIRKHILKWLRK